ncbi:hypothetical protein G7043_42345 [Lentzea sp. NEAU-D13]|uniref:Uncharacterized protein n=1 Tax=Lentzea alba TaxID=2714351 RepID=A0A7C9VYX9_9PSEU|nr:DUF6339 family protein [Lentzea alba]NGY65555.1 hypothetical protein [Lentzea alba]
MSELPAVDFPAVLGLLPDTAVTKHLSHAVQAGKDFFVPSALRRAVDAEFEDQPRWHVGPVRVLVDEAMDRFEGRRSKADVWLAPRLHATLRMTRAEAADSRLWNYLAMLVAPDYVVWRHRGSKSGIAKTSRFSGRHDLQAFARLWWSAELFRDGSDYRPVEPFWAYQDAVNSIMRLEIIDHRPTAAAMVRIVERLANEGVPNASDHVNGLSKAVNAAGSTLVFDVIAPDSPVDHDARLDWIAESAHAAEVPWDRLPDGPDDGAVDKRAVDVLVPMFEKLLAEAPLRVRSKKDADDDD